VRVLALDLATKTGWALSHPDGKTLHESGVEDFSLRRGESPGMRYLKFNRWLRSVIELCNKPSDPDDNRIGLVAHEMAHHRGGAATEVAAGLVTRVQEACAEYGIEYTSVHSNTLKKHATGHGHAGKDAMIAAAFEKFGVHSVDDNQADALNVLDWAIHEFMK